MVSYVKAERQLRRHIRSALDLAKRALLLQAYDRLYHASIRYTLYLSLLLTAIIYCGTRCFMVGPMHFNRVFFLFLASALEISFCDSFDETYLKRSNVQIQY